jgi:two-component system, OmpR family, sensor kinase
MSSSPRAERVRHWLKGWSLRTRLIAALVGLVTVVCLVIGVASEVAVYNIQLRQLDEQVRNAAARTPHGPFLPGADGFPPRSGRGGEGPGPPPGTVVAYISGGTVTSGWIVSDDGGHRDLSAADRAVLTALPADGRLYSRTLGAEDYRLTARTDRQGPFNSGGGDMTTVTGLPLSLVQQPLYQLAAVEVGLTLAALLLAALIGALVVRRTLRPLDRVAATARRVAELPLDRGEVALSVRVPDADPRTEIGQVGTAINRMLGHVAGALAARQASEMRVRHFVADASHELRTPLAAIRGYAELSRRVRDGVPPDVTHAMRRVESEAARMTVLVEDMLLLARLDSGRPLATEPVDLSRLVIDAVSDAHIAGPDHRWQLDLPEESVTVAGDAARLHQVLANLLANGRTHTPAGTTVTTRLAVVDGVATLTVSDDGQGIPADLLPDVFDRFARGDTSRSRAAGSTGLGLAIVAAVVEAHGGSVEVSSRPGWTAFTVRLPASRPASVESVARDVVRH